MESLEALTPMMRQYREVKNTIPSDAILFFRLGDFYEMFFEDAVKGSKLLDITLTKRNTIPMCGIPFHALDNYLPKLAQLGVKIAIADQVEDPKLVKGIVKREVTRIITPGTLIDTSTLIPTQSNYLSAISLTAKTRYGLAYLDVSTGVFKITELDSIEDLANELLRLQTKEVLIPESLFADWKTQNLKLLSDSSVLWTALEDDIFACDTCDNYLKNHFAVATLESFGCHGLTSAISAAGAALYYAVENLKHEAKHITSLKYYNTKDFMLLDNATRRNLELLESARGLKENSLITVLDDTRTSMGGRLLREWIVQPLYSKDRINQRLESVESFKDEPLTLAELQETLCAVKDLERIIGRINIGSSNARDLSSLASSLEVLPGLKTILSNYKATLIESLDLQIKLFPDITTLIEKAIVEEPPLSITDGGMVRDGFNSELDEFRSASREGKNWIAALQTKEQERTGIKSLKIRFNNVFGYYIEITRSNLQSVPQDYIRKQTMVNAERYITPELKEVENKVLGAEDKAKALEYELFQEIREKCASFTKDIRDTAQAIASIDVLCAFAETARKNDYRRPTITNDDSINITGGRHPVVESLLKDERFVSNDTFLDNRENNIIIITGPNMAGKSTYIRQVALIVLMAQMGSFVPAEKAEIGIVDRIFTRVGASDDLSKGQSTFMVEMVETANILNNATSKSLVILDEIGRGTSTFDGLSIAWSVAEFIHNTPSSRAKTLFATHYHELTELAMTCSGVKNFNVAVKEYGDKVIFLRQIIAGAADKSYGIYVAKLAGLPEKVISRAKEILENLENNAIKEGQPTLASHKGKHRKKQPSSDCPEQLELF